MSVDEPFFDTSVLLYLVSNDLRKANRVEDLLADRGIISVQVLNEFASVAVRKIKMPPEIVKDILGTVRAVCSVEPITLATHDRGFEIHERYGFSIYDSMLVASALLAETRVLYSEHLQHRQSIEGKLRVLNPFARN